jgi:hypothetical protein
MIYDRLAYFMSLAGNVLPSFDSSLQILEQSLLGYFHCGSPLFYLDNEIILLQGARKKLCKYVKTVLNITSVAVLYKVAMQRPSSTEIS